MCALRLCLVSFEVAKNYFLPWGIALSVASLSSRGYDAAVLCVCVCVKSMEENCCIHHDIADCLVASSLSPCQSVSSRALYNPKPSSRHGLRRNEFDAELFGVLGAAGEGCDKRLRQRGTQEELCGWRQFCSSEWEEELSDRAEGGLSTAQRF